MNSPSYRPPACCCSSAPGAQPLASRSSIVPPAASVAAPACSPARHRRSWPAVHDCCRCPGSAPSLACVAARGAGKGGSTMAGPPSRSGMRSKCCAPVGGCGCAVPPAAVVTGSGSMRRARPGSRIGRCAVGCARPRRVASWPRRAPQGGRRTGRRPCNRDGVHAAVVRMRPERELSAAGPVYPAHDAHASWSIPWHQDNRPGRRA